VLEFEWDDNKSSSNIEKHGIDFETARLIWFGDVLEAPDIRKDYGEDRFLTFGEADGEIISVVYTWRGDSRRIISARMANRGERSAYRQEVLGGP
jgi:uncharacterized DUF497 family protein